MVQYIYKFIRKIERKRERKREEYTRDIIYIFFSPRS